MSFFKKIKKSKLTPGKKLRLPIDNSWAIIPNNTIKNIANRLPKNLTYTEKMYFLYMELGIVSNSSLRFYFIKLDRRKKQKRVLKKNPTHYLSQLCKVYVKLLEKVNLNFTYNIVKEDIKIFTPYTFLFINIDNKVYPLSIYQDLKRIQSTRRTKKFAGLPYSFTKLTNEEKEARIKSVDLLEKKYGPFYLIPRIDLKHIEMKLDYDFGGRINPFKPVTIDIIIHQMKLDIQDSNLYRNYILAGRTPEPHAEIRYVLGFIFKHLRIQCRLLNLNYIETLQYFKTYIYELVPKKDLNRIRIFDIYFSKTDVNMISLLRINNDIYPGSMAEQPYTVYMFSNYSSTFTKLPPKEVYKLKKRLQYAPHKIIEYKNEEAELVTKDLDLLHGIKIINAPPDFNK